MTRPIAAFLVIIPLAACMPGDAGEAAGMGGSAAASPAASTSATPPDTPVSSLDPPGKPQLPPTPTQECPVAASRGWSAAVFGKPPSSSGDRLRVAGTVTLARSGYRARLEQGPVLEIHPPIQRLELAFEGGGADGPREVEVHGEFPALSEYGAIEIRCGTRTVVTITSVAWTENAIMEKDH